ncbi:ARPP-1 family domain-containing protein [Methanobrevibacter sp.]
MIISGINEINSGIELLKPQSHEHVAIIPLKTEPNYKLDILTLKKGFELGLVEVKELKESTVNTLTVKNNSVTPLLLIDGEEVVGGDQNRIVNSTILVAPKSECNISVSCTEHGRWKYKSEFKSSPHIADYNTRMSKLMAERSNKPVQSEVWSSINRLERSIEFSSDTQAMSESYDSQRTNHEEFLKEFNIVDGQNGVLIIVNGEIKGFEILLNPEIYSHFHEKIIKSYLINSKAENTTFTVNTNEAELLIENAKDSTFEDKKSNGLEKAYEFENSDGFGNLYIYEDEILHWSYFIKISEDEEDEGLKDSVEPTEIII